MKIAIDGPSGAGKSSVAKLLAARLGFIYVDTGALYRSIGLYIRNNGVDPKDAVAVTARLPEITVEIKYENGTQQVYLNGECVGDRIRENEISMYASAVSAIPSVRAFLLDTQRSIANSNDVIMDGRDIGTVILPDAEVKIFLCASNEARAKRRYKELTEKGHNVNYDEILADIITRDNNDRNRAIAPAIPAEDAVILDNSDIDLEGTLIRAIEIINEKTGKNYGK